MDEEQSELITAYRDVAIAAQELKDGADSWTWYEQMAVYRVEFGLMQELSDTLARLEKVLRGD